MTADPVEGDVEILRARIAQLETALRLVRDLMRDLPAPDNVAIVAVRLRKHFDTFAGDVIADALAAPDGLRDDDDYAHH